MLIDPIALARILIASPYAISLLGCAALFAGMICGAVSGHRAGRRWVARRQTSGELNTGVVDAAVLSLLGLLIAFTFSGAYGRYEQRRELIVEEANAIGTAYLRLRLLPADQQPALRETFREYAKSRFDTWRLLIDPAAARAEIDKSSKLQEEIWSAAIEATEGETTGDARKLLLPALNEMIDITTIRLIAVQSHPPSVIFLVLGLLALASAWIVGFGMAKSDALSYSHAIGFAAAVALALLLIIDIEYPRYGLVTLDGPHEILNELYQGME
jgi:hypothetical protein